EGRAAAVGAVDDDDCLVGEFDARIVLGDCRTVPVGDLAKKDVGQNVRRELDLAADAGDVVGGYDRTHDGRNMQDLRLCFLQLLVRHGAIAGSEIDGAIQNLANAATAADRLVVDLHVRVQLV